MVIPTVSGGSGWPEQGRAGVKVSKERVLADNKYNFFYKVMKK